MIAPLERLGTNPLVTPNQISFTHAAGTFNPGVCVDHASGRVVLLVRVFEVDARRSCLVLALSSDGEHVDEIWDLPVVTRDEPYEEWGVEDARITYLADEGRYAITYTGYSPAGPRICLITTDDLLTPASYQRHGPRIVGHNKNCVVFPQKVDGQYVILHRPVAGIVCLRVNSLEDEWPREGVEIVDPQPGTWRSSRVGAGAPPLLTRLGWLMPFHGATTIPEGNVYSMGWCLLDTETPEKVLYVSDVAPLTPQASYEIDDGPLIQLDMANFIHGVHVVFPQGLVERGDDLLVYYGAADVSVAAARVNKESLLLSLAEEMAAGNNPEVGRRPVLIG